MKFLKSLIGSFRKMFRGPSRRKKKKSLRKAVAHSRKKAPQQKKKVRKVLRRVSSKAAPRKVASKTKVSSKPKKVNKVMPSVPKMQPEGLLVGEVTHYFSRIQVIVVKITRESIKVADTLLIKGKLSNFKQSVKSLQIESVDVKRAKKGQLVGLKVDREARVGDKVFKLKTP